MLRDELIKYEEKFNSSSAKMTMDTSWVTYYDHQNPRHRGVADRHNYMVENLNGGIILDIGCGDGLGCYLLAQRKDVKEVWGVDIYERSIRVAMSYISCKPNFEKIRIIKAYSEMLPFMDEHFDSVNMGHTLEHVYDDKETVKEAYRVLKKKGIIIAGVPLGGSTGLMHIRAYTDRDFLNLMNSHFKILDFWKTANKRAMRYKGIKE